MPVKEFRRSSASRMPNEMVAAATVDVTNPNQMLKLRAVHVVSKTRTNRAWDWYDKIGEVRYSLNKSAKVAGHAVLHPVKRRGATLGAKIENGSVIDPIVAGIWSPNGGQRGLIETFYKLMRMHGQAHLIRLPRNSDSSSGGYDFISDEELDVDADGVWRITLPISMMAGFSDTDLKKATRVKIEPEDYLGRVWVPHPKYSDMPDSPMYALDTVCEELHLLTLGVKAKLMSRLALAGVWYIPSEVSEVNKSYTTQEENAPRYSTDEVINAIILSLLHNVTSHGDASAQFPIIMRGPGDQAENVRFITIDQQVFEIDIRLREEALTRILQGLDSKPEAVKGNSESNHWNTWATSADDLRENVMPDLEMLCWTLEQLIIVPEAERLGIDVEEVGLWFDLASATARPNLGEDARLGRDGGYVSGKGARELNGISEEYAPSEEEYVRWLGAKMGDPYLATFALPVQAKIDFEKVGMANDPTPGPDPLPKPGKVGPGNPGSDGTTGKTDTNKPRSKRPAA